MAFEKALLGQGSHVLSIAFVAAVATNSPGTQSVSAIQAVAFEAFEKLTLMVQSSHVLSEV